MLNESCTCIEEVFSVSHIERVRVRGVKYFQYTVSAICPVCQEQRIVAVYTCESWEYDMLANSRDISIEFYCD